MHTIYCLNRFVVCLPTIRLPKTSDSFAIQKKTPSASLCFLITHIYLDLTNLALVRTNRTTSTKQPHYSIYIYSTTTEHFRSDVTQPPTPKQQRQ
jgi:hypothetical protein